MSTITTSFAPTLNSTPSPLPTTTTPIYKSQHEPLVLNEDNDDDISLAKCMSRKLQLNQQVTVMYPCIPPNYMTLQQQQALWKANDPMYAINTPAMNDYQHPFYGQNLSYGHYQQQSMLQQQQQLAFMGYNGLSRNSPQHRTNHRSSVPKSRSAPMDSPPDPKIKIPSSSTSSSLASSTHHIRSSTHNSSSTSSLHSESTRKKGYQHQIRRQQQQQQQQQRSSSPVPSLVDDSGTWRSSIYSHNSTASSSVKTTSETTSFTNAPIHSSAASISSSMSKTDNNNNKRSLSKRIKGVFAGSKQQNSSLRRSPSMVSCASSVMTTNTMSSGYNGGFSRSSWTSLFRKSSKSEKISTNQRDSSVHAETPTTQQKVVVPLDSPASSISSKSYRHSSSSSSRQENGYIGDLPSPAPSTTADSPSKQHHRSHDGKTRQQIRSSPIMDGQQDYFGLPSSRHLPRNHSSSFLQHGSPVLRPSLNNNYNNNSNSTLVSEDDDISACMMDGMKPRSRKTGSKIQFTTTIQVHDTFGSQDYDRRCDTQVTCQRLTPVLALQIKKELNEFKLNEMVVHPSSRQYTQFFL